MYPCFALTILWLSTERESYGENGRRVHTCFHSHKGSKHTGTWTNRHLLTRTRTCEAWARYTRFHVTAGTARLHWGSELKETVHSAGASVSLHPALLQSPGEVWVHGPFVGYYANEVEFNLR